MGIFSFNKFINEKLGVSRPSILFSGILISRINGIFDEFLHSGINTYSKTAEINYRTLNSYTNTNSTTYLDFPVSKFEIQLNFKKLTNKQFLKKYPSFKGIANIATGGSANYFGNKNWSNYSRIISPIKQISDHGLIINIRIDIDINEDFKFTDKKDFERYQDDIGSTVYHELNHSYESYKRVINSKSKSIRPEYRTYDTTLSWSKNTLKFPKTIYKKWYEFTYFLYISEHHETRANIQELYYYIKKHPEKNLSDFRIYKKAIEMCNFKGKDFYKELINKISEYEPYKGDEQNIANRIKNMWVDDYKKQCDTQKVNPIISISYLKNIDCKEFLIYWQKRINKSGEEIKRKAHKLKAI